MVEPKKYQDWDQDSAKKNAKDGAKVVSIICQDYWQGTAKTGVKVMLRQCQGSVKISVKVLLGLVSR